MLATIALLSPGHVLSDPADGVFLNDCPWNSGRSWRSYFLESPRGGNANLQFRSSSNIPDDVGWKGKCQSLTYSLGDGGWAISGYYHGLKWHALNIVYFDGSTLFRYFDEDAQRYRTARSPANTETFRSPTDFKINIRNDYLTFNEAGEVYHAEYGLVGELLCCTCIRN